MYRERERSQNTGWEKERRREEAREREGEKEEGSQRERERERDDSLDVLERDLLGLPGHHGEDVHLQGAEAQGSIILQLRAKSLQNYIITALSNGREREMSYLQ